LFIWQSVARSAFEYLIDLSHSQSQVPEALPSNLLSSQSIPDRIDQIFRMYIVECSLYQNVNHFLRCFPIKIVGILHYIYFLQSALEYCSYHHPPSNNLCVYRGFVSRGGRLASLYAVIVWPSFTSASTDRDCVIDKFIKDENSILFENALHPGDVAVCIAEHSAVLQNLRL
jgi:hypothetical protein